MPLLKLNHVKKVYNEKAANAVTALKDINFTVEKGEYVAIMGESGAGKSTLLNIMATLDKATGGQAILGGQDLGTLKPDDAARFRREHLGFVFQDFNLLDSLSNKDNIFLPLVLAKTSVDEMEQRLQELAPKLGISQILDRYPVEASGGQQQRVAVARALIARPDLLLADEPTGALDSATSKQLLHLFDEVNGKGQTIIMVTHSTAAASYSKRTLFIKDGRIYHEIFRGDLDQRTYQEQINNAMVALTGGDADAQ